MWRTLAPASGQLAGLACPVTPAAQPPAAAVPIWFAALTAVRCQARTPSEKRVVLWDCVAGKAVYTNRGLDLETIEPLGVQLHGGQSVAVSWMPGESAYTVEVFRQFDYVA